MIAILPLQSTGGGFGEHRWGTWGMKSEKLIPKNYWFGIIYFYKPQDCFPLFHLHVLNKAPLDRSIYFG